MIQTKMVLQRVILTVVVGMTLFLFGCKPAVELKKALVKKGPGGEEIFSKAEALYGEKKFNDALVLYSKYLEVAPNGKAAPDCLKRIGDIYLKQGRPDEALESYTRIRRDFPHYRNIAEVVYGIISAFYKMGALDEVIREGNNWITRYPGSPLKPSVALLIAKSYYAKLKEAEALTWLMRAEKGFESVNTERAKEISSEIRGLINEADKAGLERMLKVALNTKYYPPIAYKLASIYYRTGELEKAEQTVTELLQAPVQEHWLERARKLYDMVFMALNVEGDKIGCLLPLSGPFGIYGEEVLNGIEMGMNIFGSADRGIELIIKDTAGDPKKAGEAVEELVRQDHVIAAMGPLLSRCAEYAAKRAEALGLPLITLCRKEDIVKEGHMIFRNFLLPKREVEQLIHVAMDRLGIRRFAIMYPDNAYGRYFMQLFWDGVEEHGGQIRAAEPYATSVTDFAAQINRMVGIDIPRPKRVVERIRASRLPVEEESELDPEAKDPIVDFDAVFIPDSAERVAMIAPQLVYHNVTDVWLLGTSLWNSPRLLSLAGDYLQGSIFTSGFFPSAQDEQVQQFVEQYRNNYEKEPGLLAATGYDTIRLIRRIIEESSPRTRSEMRNALEESTPYKGVTGDISFHSNGEVEKRPFVVTVLGSRELLFP